MPYRFLDDVAVADIAFEAWDEALEGMFTAAAEATLKVMLDAPQAVEPRERRDIELEHEVLDLLLFNFLGEIIFFKDAERLMLRARDLRVEPGPPYRLKAVLVGERLDVDRHHPRVDVKAVTLHRFSVEQSEAGWRATVILDI